jgi:hypothetical protein
MDVPQVTNNAPVTVALVANAICAIVIAVAKQRFGVDFSGQEANLQVLATGLGYFVSQEVDALNATSAPVAAPARAA